MYTLAQRNIGSIILNMSKHKPITQEMIADLSRMGDKDFAEKWGTSRQYPIRNRKRLGIIPFNAQSGLRERKVIDGVEHKFCPRGGGHYCPITEFGKANNRFDGLRGLCKHHEHQDLRKAYHEGNGKEKAQAWRGTNSGKESLRRTWRRSKAIKDNAYILWLPEHEQAAYNYFGGRCSYCGKPVEFLKVEFDHFIPIKNGGKTHPSNMLPSCHKCNHGKGGKFTREALEWLREKFGELNGNMIYLVCQTALSQLGEGR